MSMASLVQVKDLSKAWTNTGGEIVEVLRSVSFEINGPAIVGIVGPNGVGKTVMERILAGLLKPDTGCVKINGKDPSECRIGWVPASNPVYGWRRAIDDIGIGLECAGMPRKARHDYVVEFMRRFSIDLPLHRRTFCFSTGQRQITNLARTLVGPSPPDIVVLDEPWASLSPNVREELLRCLEAVREEMGTVIFLTAHSLDLAILACDWIIPMREKPVTINQQSLIRVDLQHPRNSASRQDPEFKNLLMHFESLFYPEIPVPA